MVEIEGVLSKLPYFRMCYMSADLMTWAFLRANLPSQTTGRTILSPKKILIELWLIILGAIVMVVRKSECFLLYSLIIFPSDCLLDQIFLLLINFLYFVDIKQVDPLMKIVLQCQ